MAKGTAQKLENVTKDARPVVDFDGLAAAFERVAADFCDSLKLDSLAAATQGQFNACCDLIRVSVIEPNKRYLTKSDNYIYNGIEGLDTNYNAYDPDKLSRIYDAFVFFADKYDKVPTGEAFSRLCGLYYSTLWSWGNSGDSADSVTRRRYQLAKRVKAGAESGLRSALLTGRRNAVALLGVANHDHGWNLPGVTRETVSRPALASGDLPRLDDSQKPIDAPGLPGPELLET